VVFLAISALSLPLLKMEDLSLMCGALLTITCAVLLGFADDVLNLRWRHKLWAPAFSTIPLLAVYFTLGGQTEVLLPSCLHQFHFSVGGIEILSRGGILQLGPFYYCYLIALIIFCTNAINILAGVNGLETGQAFVMGVGFILYNTIELYSDETLQEHRGCHHRSLTLMFPFVGCVLALLEANWFPASVFVGDTFCYWAGCTLATTGIVGRFSKTALLFFIPQILNFLYGLPQLFHLIPCPRHRLPKFNSETGLREMSTTKVKLEKLHPIGRLWIQAGSLLRVIHVTQLEDGEVEVNNLTNLNLTLKLTGPISEEHLTMVLLAEQICAVLLALFIRYYVAGFLYHRTT